MPGRARPKRGHSVAHPAEAAAAQTARNGAVFGAPNEHIESYADPIGALDGDPLPLRRRLVH
jgi:hypothetical protein